MQTKKNKKNRNKYTRKKTKTKTSNNFYGVVNSKWFNKIKIKDDRVSINEYNILQDKVDKQLQKIVTDLRSNNNINKLYLSFYKFHLTRDNVELEVKKIISLLDVVRNDKKNIWRYLAYCSKHRINHPFYWALTIDQKTVNKYVCSIGENGLGLNDKGHYTKRGKYIEIRQEYLKYIEKCFVLLLGKNHNCKAEDVLKIETQLSKYTRNEIENRDPKLTYNTYTMKSLNDIGFNSHEFLKKLGYAKYPPLIVITNPKYIKETCKFLKNWNDDFWYSYWVFKIFNSFARFHEDWRNHEFEFYEKFLMGQKKLFLLKSLPLNLAYLP